MFTSFLSLEDFSSALLEVETILDYAKRNQKNKNKYPVFIKSALLFLVAKFESFLEDVVTESIEIIQNKGLCANDLPELLKVHCLDYLIDEKFISDIRSHNFRVLKTLKKISVFCMEDEQINSIEIDKGFDYGKHGQKAIERLFERVGIEDVFSACDVYETRDSLIASGEEKVRINIAADINAITNYRNNILHNDETPNLTHEQIGIYKDHLILFSERLIEILANSIDILGQK